MTTVLITLVTILSILCVDEFTDKPPMQKKWTRDDL